MDAVTRNAEDLSNPDRRAIEHLLGKALDSDDHVVVIAYKAAAGEQLIRDQARVRVEGLLIQAESHAIASGISSDEADEAIAEAMRAVRPRFTP